MEENMRPKIRPRRRSESLKQYVDAVIEDFRARAGLKAKSVDSAWDEIFKAICYEGQYVREVSPAAVVIYQRYFTMAANFLKDYPDRNKHRELVERAKKDLGHNLTWFSKMEEIEREYDTSLFTLEERKEGSKAFELIRKTLLSIA